MIQEIQIRRGDTLIADGDPRGAGVVEELMVNGTAILDVATFLFATRPTIFDRDTRTLEVSFKIFREHLTRTLALDRALRGPIGSLGVDDLVLTLVEDGVETHWRTSAAGWQAIAAPELGGFSASLGFRVISGGFEAPVEGDELAGDLDGGNDDGALTFTGDWDGLSETDDDGAIVESIDGLEDAA